MAVNHVILKEFHHDKKTVYFNNYLKKYSDNPFLVELDPADEGYNPGKLFRASRISNYEDVENGEWKFLLWDEESDEPKMPGGTVGSRWQEKKGKWNLKLEDELTGESIDPRLTFIDSKDETRMVRIKDHGSDSTLKREVPVKLVETVDGETVPVTTVFDLLMTQFGVNRGLSGDYPEDYDSEIPYTPAWQEKYTGISKDSLVKFAREWASTAEESEGKCMIIIGAGINHWYHNNLIYRAAITSLILCGCVGKNGGGLNHYVGQEKVAPLSSWATLALGKDWEGPPRVQNTPSFHYVHTNQWKYEDTKIDTSRREGYSDMTGKHTMDNQIEAVKKVWLPFFPQFDRNPIEIVEEAKQQGVDEEDIPDWIAEQIKKGEIKYSVEDPDAPENWPRNLFIWRGNALMSSAKGHEYFLKHYLGVESGIESEEISEDMVDEVDWKESGEGKLDLVVDLNFRMDTSALYSDIVLPAATWYEKNDLNSTDMHSYIHPLSEVVPPCWESKSDYDIFKNLAKKVQDLAEEHLSSPVKDILSTPLLHDTPDELSQPEIEDWEDGEAEAVPGKTMPNISVVERDYTQIYDKFVSLSDSLKEDGIGAHGLSWDVEDFYEELVEKNPTEEWDGKSYPSLREAKDAANVILRLSPATNGELAYRAFKNKEQKTGLKLKDLAEGTRDVRYSFDDLLKQPRRLLTSPVWSGVMEKGRTYAAYSMNVEREIPWRTLTGRQSLYLDHEGYLAFDENMPIYKPKADIVATGDLQQSEEADETVTLNYLTPHGKWSIHSTFSDNERMQTLSRGVYPLWINDEDAESIGISDNDWIELFNDHGVVVTRAAVSARIPRGICMQEHSPERTFGVPKSPRKDGKRAGGHNSLTRIRLKPNLMMGGYAQFTYFFNYWGPVGVNRDTFIKVRKLPGKPEW